MVLGWSWIGCGIVQHYLDGGEPKDVWQKMEGRIIIFQYGAILEIVHCVLKLVRSGLATTFLQVAHPLKPRTPHV